MNSLHGCRVCCAIVNRCGAERTGIFIAMLNMMDELNAQQHVDVFNSVKRVRSSRPEFVPTLVRQLLC